MVASVAKRDSGSIELGDGSELDNTDDDIVSGLGKISYTFGEPHRVEGSYLTFRNTAEEPNHGQDIDGDDLVEKNIRSARSAEHTSELQSLMSNSYAVFSLKQQKYSY